MPNKPSIVLCEGTSDEAFIDALIQARNIQNVRVKVRDAIKHPPGVGGFGKRLEALKIDSDTERRHSIVFLADNDLSVDNLYSSIAGLIAAAGDYHLPPRVWNASPRGRFPPLHIVSLPDNHNPGCAETLWLQAAERARPNLKHCVEAFSRCVNIGTWSPSNVSKLLLRCLIAAAFPDNPTLKIEKVWFDAEGNPRNIIPLADPCFNRLADYLGNL